MSLAGRTGPGQAVTHCVTRRTQQHLQKRDGHPASVRSGARLEGPEGKGPSGGWGRRRDQAVGASGQPGGGKSPALAGIPHLLPAYGERVNPTECQCLAHAPAGTWAQGAASFCIRGTYCHSPGTAAPRPFTRLVLQSCPVPRVPLPPSPSYRSFSYLMSSLFRIVIQNLTSSPYACRI
ncbi:hypothetical protein NDU88_011307 [Pleurodeles waltl]|uniref:Uncharacterized protein n=1 Tax=Pleurodeles waltl TaxID=8319 RepID=A0AAV7S260_PLEWA|nr:hypothetical protein NDU88_011307 [Pleurodeles waltl]